MLIDIVETLLVIGVQLGAVAGIVYLVTQYVIRKVLKEEKDKTCNNKTTPKDS